IMANGSRHSLYVAVESAYGVVPNNPALELVRITGTTLGLSKDSLQSAEIRSDRQLSDFRLGANQVNGDINFELSYGSFDKLLLGALQASGWTPNTPVSGTDEAKVGQTRHSYTLIRHFADIQAADNPYYIYGGVEINSLQLTIAANAMITGVLSVIGQSQTTAQNLAAFGTPTFPPASTTTPLDSFTGALTEGGVPI